MIGTCANWGKNLDHSDYNIIKFDQNTGKSPGDLWWVCCFLHFSERPPANVGANDLQGVKS